MKTSKWVVQEVDVELQQQLINKLNISPILANLLMNRGLTDPEEIFIFLEPSLEKLSSPFALLNMGAAVERILQGISDNEKIMVYGDYDVDGICASIILYEGLLSLGAQVDYYVPDRIEEGYGVNQSAIEKICDDGITLMITVDCGVSAVDEITYAQTMGLEVIVTDHHQLPSQLPQCIMVNPVLLREDGDPWAHLCGAGVSFKLVQGLFEVHYGENRIIERMIPYLDLVALATVADIVPLKGDNRILVKYGMEQIQSGHRIGLEALWKVARSNENSKVDTTALGFGIAPRLNACGRIGDVQLGLKLLTTKNQELAQQIAQLLDEENKSRQYIEKNIMKEALLQVEQQVHNLHQGIVIWGEDWHPGVIGIVASRLVEKFYTPSIVLTLSNGVYKGSGRSIEGIHLQQLLSQCAHLLEAFGGHAQAVGLTIKPENLEEFRCTFARMIAEQSHHEMFTPKLTIDSEIDLEQLNDEIYHEISKLQPTGQANPKPIFVCRQQQPVEVRLVGSGSEHLRIKLKSKLGEIAGIGFKKGELLSIIENQWVDIAFHLDENVFNGRTALQMLIRDMKPHQRPDDLGLIDRLFFYHKEYLKPDPYQGIENAETFFTKIVGVTFENRQHSIEKLSVGTILTLTRQPENPYDENAIAVVYGSEQMGFLKKELSKHLAVQMDEGTSYQATVLQITGKETQNFGVNILVRRESTGLELQHKLRMQKKQQLQLLDDEQLKAEIRSALIGKHDYRPKQKEAIYQLEQGNSVFAILGTGRGKSAIFQSYSAYNALKKNKVTIIVYPLRALVNDQLFGLEQKLSPLGLQICKGTGALEGEERILFFQQIEQGEIDIILTTPEFLIYNYERFQRIGEKIGMVVIDEAHHLASRRSGYKQLPGILQRIGVVQVLAVTATANDQIAEYITKQLHVETVVVDPHIRENLQLVDKRNNNDKIGYLLQLVKRQEKMVIYVNSRRQAVKIAQEIRNKCHDSQHETICYYHGGLANHDRQAIEHAFRDGSIQVIVTTSAFGEGIDIADIVHVVLYHLSFSREEYNQLAGRAGRNGEKAWVHLLYTKRDEQLNQMLLAASCPSRDSLAKFYMLLKKIANETPEIGLTNIQLAEIAEKEKISGLSENAVGHWLGIFDELGIIQRERQGNRRSITLIPSTQKMNLESSLRYLEGMAEMEDYQNYLEIAFEHNQEILLSTMNRPIFPRKWLSNEEEV